MINDLAKRIQGHEGLRLTPYKDSVGVLTIGYGHNLERGITREVADLIFQRDLEDAAEDAQKLPFFLTLDDTRQEILIEMIFQMGLARVKGFKRMSAALGHRNYDAAANEMLDSKWAKSDSPSRAQYLADAMRLGRFGGRGEEQ